MKFYIKILLTVILLKVILNTLLNPNNVIPNGGIIFAID